MRTRLIALLTVVLLGVPATAWAQTTTTLPPEPPPRCFDCPFILPDGRVAVESYDVDVQIAGQVATTHVTQVFRNDGHRLAEGVFLFPLPAGAAVSELILWMDNEPVRGELLGADEARGIYEEIVRTLRDPALLEWVGRDLIRLSVFPIEPGDSRTVELEYSEILAADGGLIRYTQALGAEHPTIIEKATVRVEADSAAPIKAIYSPSHSLDVNRDGDHAFVATYEATRVDANEEFALYFSVSGDDITINVLTTRTDGDGDGFFLMLLNPKLVAADEAIARDVIFVLDRSGSMEGEKFEQARSALRFVLDNLNPDDHFNVITFSSRVTSYARGLRPAAEAADAIRWVDSQAAGGSTDINQALLEAFAQTSGERPAYVVFLTDGLPTEGATDIDVILDNALANAPEDVSLFAFGVGFDVDAFLLDSLAVDHHGTTDYVLPGEDIDEVVSGFYAKVSTPVLTRIAIEFGDSEVYDIHPFPLPDLFAGEQLTLVGRYRRPTTTSVELTGRVGEDRATFTYDNVGFRVAGGPDFVPRLWATRKIGDLLRDMRLDGVNDEIVGQIVDLSTRYGIVTPFTSFLVEEPGLLGRRLRDEAADQAGAWFRSSLGDTAGEAAVEYSVGAQDLTAATAAPSPTTTTLVDGEGNVLGAPAPVAVTTAGGRTFRLIDGVWVDSEFDPDVGDVLAVPFLSDVYFELVAAIPEVADAFALGEAVIVLHSGTAYQVVGADQPGDPIDVPDPVTEPTVAQPEAVPVRIDTEITAAPVDRSPEAAPEPAPGNGGSAGGWSAAIAATALTGLAVAGGWAIRARRRRA